jgi:Tfp pilus assembly protein PilX
MFRKQLDLRDDRGVAMMTVIMVASVLTALGMAAVTVTSTNIKNAGRDRFATTAQGAAEAAVAAAESYLQTVPGTALACSPTCSTNTWGNKAAPNSLAYPNGRTATVWIELRQTYAPPAYKSYDYIIHAIGKSSSAVGVRTIDEEVSVEPLNFPFGIYIDAKINDQGTPGVTNESVFSRTCIDSRRKIQFSGIDPYYGIPAAAHSAQYITDSNQGSCNTNLVDEEMHDQKAIHYDATGSTPSKNTCDSDTSAFDARYDEDALGGPFSNDLTDGSVCQNAPNQQTKMSSYFDNNMLTNQYNFTPKGLTDAQYAMLKSSAQAQGNYYTSTSSINWAHASTMVNPVVYFDLSSGQSVNIGSGDVAAYAWQNEAGGTCVAQHPSIIIVVRNGDVSLGSGVAMTGAIFAPEGNITISGGVNLVGTVFANTAKVTGTASLSLNDCYIKNLPGGIMSVTPTRFHEVDR